MKQKMVQCSYFNLNSEALYLNKKIKLHYEYENLKDHIPANEMEVYKSNYEAALEACQGRNLTLNNNISYGSSEFPLTTTDSTGNIFAQLYVILAFFVIITVIIKRKHRQEQF